MGVFLLLSNAVSIYGLLCLIRIILTWIPSMNYNRFTLFLGKICDPYLNLFRNIKFLRLGYVDFSPAFAMGILVLASSLLNTLMLQKRITILGIIAAIISMIWSIISSIASLVILLMIIRLVLLFLAPGKPGAFWQGFDSVFNPIAYKISSFFTSQKNKFITQKKAYIIGIIALVVLRFLLKIIIRLVVSILIQIPI